MSITERIASLSAAQERSKNSKREVVSTLENASSEVLINYLNKIPEAVRLQHQLFAELRATGLISMIKEVAHSIYLEPDGVPYYEKYVDGIRTGEKGSVREELTQDQIDELQSKVDLDWFAQTLPLLDIESDGTPMRDNLEISLLKRSESAFVRIYYSEARDLQIVGSDTTFRGHINVNNLKRNLPKRLESSFAKAIVEPFRGFQR